MYLFHSTDICTDGAKPMVGKIGGAFALNESSDIRLAVSPFLPGTQCENVSLKNVLVEAVRIISLNLEP